MPVLEQISISLDGEERLGRTFHQPAMFENTIPPAFNHTRINNDRLSPTQRPLAMNTINQSPAISGQCPFSGHKIEIKTSAV
jgi:hypothetical protein